MNMAVSLRLCVSGTRPPPVLRGFLYELFSLNTDSQAVLCHLQPAAAMKTLQVTHAEGRRPLRRPTAAAEKVASSRVRGHIAAAKMSSEVQEAPQKFRMRERTELGSIFVHLFHSLVQREVSPCVSRPF